MNKCFRSLAIQGKTFFLEFSSNEQNIFFFCFVSTFLKIFLSSWSKWFLLRLIDYWNKRIYQLERNSLFFETILNQINTKARRVDYSQPSRVSFSQVFWGSPLVKKFPSEIESPQYCEEFKVRLRGLNSLAYEFDKKDWNLDPMINKNDYIQFLGSLRINSIWNNLNVLN